MSRPHETPVRAPFGTSFRGRSVFVTGAYGMLGARLTRALIEHGAAVSVLRREPRPGSALALDGTEAECRVIDGDLLDAGLLEQVVRDGAIDTVVHLAAQTIVETATRSPRWTFESNLRGTWNVLEAARLAGAERTVVAGSYTAYGPSEVRPFSEALPLSAIHPYDTSKAAADMIARSYWHTYGVPVAVTRCANIYGGGDRNGSRLIPAAIAAALAGRRPVVRSDGSPERDFLYVDDAVEAYLAIFDLLDVPGAPAARGGAFNIGAGVPRRVLDVVREVCVAADRPDLEPDVRGVRAAGAAGDREWVDASLLTELTGWRPRVELAAGLRMAVDWYRANPEGRPG